MNDILTGILTSPEKIQTEVFTTLYNNTSTVVQSNIESVFCHCVILYHTVIYPLRWRISSSVPQQSHNHRTSSSNKSWNIITTYTISSRMIITGRLVLQIRAVFSVDPISLITTKPWLGTMTSDSFKLIYTSTNGNIGHN